jgi:hypothetical protein
MTTHETVRGRVLLGKKYEIQAVLVELNKNLILRRIYYD